MRGPQILNRIVLVQNRDGTFQLAGENARNGLRPSELNHRNIAVGIGPVSKAGLRLSIYGMFAPARWEKAHDRKNHAFVARRRIEHGVVEPTIGPADMEILLDEIGPLLINAINQLFGFLLAFAAS